MSAGAPSFTPALSNSQDTGMPVISTLLTISPPGLFITHCVELISVSLGACAMRSGSVIEKGLSTRPVTLISQELNVSSSSSLPCMALSTASRFVSPV